MNIQKTVTQPFFCRYLAVCLSACLASPSSVNNSDMETTQPEAAGELGPGEEPVEFTDEVLLENGGQ